jgi:hypothetical protein
MTPQESQALQNFLGQLTQVQGIQKDPEAEAAISRAIAQQPDAAYLLVQRALLQDQALDSAKAQIAQLRNEVQGGRSTGTGSFLDSNNAWGRSAVSPPQSGGQSPVMQAAPAGTPTYGSGARAGRPGPGFLGGGGGNFLGGGGGSFLGSMAATAAGVAGGAFLFHGLQNLMGGDEKSAGAGSEAPPDTGGAAAEPASLADSSSMDSDSAAFDDSGFGEGTDFGGGDDGTSI